MYKHSFLDIGMKDIAAVGGTILAHMAVNAIADYGSQHYYNAMMDSLNKDPGAIQDTSKFLQKIKEDASIQHLPHATVKNYRNAAYIPPASISEEMEVGLKRQSKFLDKIPNVFAKAKAEFIRNSINMSKSKNGGIIIGDKFSHPAIVAHEVGHAKIEEEGGLNRFIQNKSSKFKNRGMWASIAGALAPAAYRVFGGKEYADTVKSVSDFLFWGGIASAGVGSLGQIYKEYLASEKGKDILEKHKMSGKHDEEILSSALKQYGIGNARFMADLLVPKYAPMATNYGMNML